MLKNTVFMRFLGFMVSFLYGKVAYRIPHFLLFFDFGDRFSDLSPFAQNDTKNEREKNANYKKMPYLSRFLTVQ